ncbi:MULTISPECIES: IS3 family transposase [Paenibacillus]|uniref:IS3 family transposase n=1 Tax=Paenibacillus TaxID=44249 RepID=UPI0003078A09
MRLVHFAFKIISFHFYNEERAQRKLNKLTPAEYRRQLAAQGFFNVRYLGS